MAIAWSRISSKVIAAPPMPMRRAEDSVRLGQAARAYVYHTSLMKESRKYEERMTQTWPVLTEARGHVSQALEQTATAKDSHGIQE
jgi:hypothetical protein